VGEHNPKTLESASESSKVVPVSRMRLDPKHTETVSVNGMKVTVACEAQEVVDPKRIFRRSTSFLRGERSCLWFGPVLRFRNVRLGRD